jgi:pimeloyl-ACP methyl ester carboxylesterase
MRSVGFAILLLILSSGCAAAQPAPETGYIDTAPGVSIYYERYGDGPNVVIVPGRLFMPEFAQLARADRTLIQYDMRNRGASRPVADVSQLTIIEDVADLEAVRRHFAAERASLVGYSYLGLMVALYATEHPDKVARLVQIGPVPRQFGTPYPADQTAGEETLSPDGMAARRAWAAARETATRASDPVALCRLQAAASNYWLVGNPANHTRVPDPCRYENEHPFTAQRHLNASFADIQTRQFPKASFVSLTAPVLTIHGTLDRNAPYGSGLEWASTFADGRLVTVDGGAHQVWLDDPEVITDVSDFFDGRWPERARSFGRR